MTSLRSLSVTRAPIPFRTSFAHASAVRSQAENVIVIVEDGDGRTGVGEGCPRPYVTGETYETACAFLETWRQDLISLGSLDALRRWTEEHRDEIDAAPSAFCAAELALLDVFGQRLGQPLEALLGVPPATDLSITAVYGSGGGLKFAAQAAAFRLFGLRAAKLKLGASLQVDVQRVSRLARHGPVRLDANNLFATVDEAIAALAHFRTDAWAVEEPVAPRDWPAMRSISQALGLAIVADESLTRLADLAAMPIDFVPNLRVSKCGGLIRSLAVLEAAKQQGRRVIVGAQVGETSVLARAGVTLASTAGPQLAACEVGYGPWLLRRDIASPPLGFGWGGVLRTGGIASRPGMGLCLNDLLPVGERRVGGAFTV
ncbi:MAG: hypothetical protein IV086_08080 [Hyphomonadaceae bacterium]|nr:hypothetical protein [Hyphomonadaceae bacterium]